MIQIAFFVQNAGNFIKMDQKKEVIYNFNELYYIFLIQRLERINVYLISERNYPYALEEFKHWFLEISYEIKEHISPLYNVLKEQIDEADFLITEYDKIHNDRKLKRREKISVLLDNEIKIKYKMNTIYVLIMECIDRLNMFFRKGTSDGDILPIYKK